MISKKKYDNWLDKNEEKKLKELKESLRAIPARKGGVKPSSAKTVSCGYLFF